MSVNDIITDGTVRYQVKEFISNTDLNNVVNTLNQTVSVIQQDVINLEDKDERKNNTIYALEDIAFFSDLPTGWYLECTTAGTTGSSLEIISPTIGDTINDGTVTWTIRKIGSGGGNSEGISINNVPSSSEGNDIWIE